MKIPVPIQIKFLAKRLKLMASRLSEMVYNRQIPGYISGNNISMTHAQRDKLNLFSECRMSNKMNIAKWPTKRIRLVVDPKINP